MNVKPQLLDLFCGQWGWSNVFAARGWECTGIDLITPARIPAGCTFISMNVLGLSPCALAGWDFICASPPCEEFAIHDMKHFHPTPKHPETGIQLFKYTRHICEESGLLYVMENVRAAQKFVGDAVHHCGPFYLWGNAVPPLMPQGIRKGVDIGSSKVLRTMTREQKRIYRKQFSRLQTSPGSIERRQFTATWATIPHELANTVADYAESLLSTGGRLQQ